MKSKIPVQVGQKYEIKITLAAEEQEIEIEMGAVIESIYYKIFSIHQIRLYKIVFDKMFF